MAHLAGCGDEASYMWRMATRTLLLVLIIPTAWTAKPQYMTNVSNAEHQLLGDLFPSSLADALSIIRPPGLVEDHGMLNITLHYDTIKVSSVDESNGYVTMTFWERLNWVDPRLVWNPSDYSNVKTMKFPPKKIWTPDLTIYTPGLGTVYDRANHPEYGTKVLLSSDGTVVYVYKNMITFHCNMDVRHFPFDTQTCPISLGSWIHNQHEVNFVLTEHSVPSYFESNHTDWKITSSKINSTTVYYPCCPEAAYQSIYLTFTLERNPWFYFYIFIVPAAAITFILPIIHCFPPACSQKSTIAGLLLVCSMFLHLMIYQQLGGFAEEKPPFLVLSYDAQLVMIVISLGISAITSCLANVVHSTSRVPAPIRKVMATVIGRICCFGTSEISGDFTQLDQSDRVSGVRFDPVHDTSPIVNDSGEEDLNQTHSEKCLHHLILELRLVRERKQFEREWHQLALIVDRLAAIAFILFFIVMSASGWEAK